MSNATSIMHIRLQQSYILISLLKETRNMAVQVGLFWLVLVLKGEDIGNNIEPN